MQPERSDSARAWVEEGVERAPASADPVAPWNAAPDRLEVLLVNNPDLAGEDVPLLEHIQTAADS